jgi:hypothetical protein
MPGLFFMGMYAYPFIERRFTGDRETHELLDRPRDHPVRTGIGVGVLTYFVVIFVAGSQDIIASKTGISVQPLVWTLRTLVFVLPALAFLIAWAWCRGLSQAATGEVETSPPIRKIGPGTPPLGVAEDGEGDEADTSPAEVAAFMDRHPLLRRVSRVATSAALAGAVRRSRRPRPPPS